MEEFKASRDSDTKKVKESKWPSKIVIVYKQNIHVS